MLPDGPEPESGLRCATERGVVTSHKTVITAIRVDPRTPSGILVLSGWPGHSIRESQCREFLFFKAFFLPHNKIYAFFKKSGNTKNVKENSPLIPLPEKNH